MHEELTIAFLKGLQPPPAGQRREIRDTLQPGLVLRITSTGVVSWAARGRGRDGREARVTLGSWPAVSLSAARKEARAALVDIVNGVDRAANKRQARAERKERAGQPTVAARLAEWQAAHERRWSPRYAGEVARLVKRELVPAIGAKRLCDINRQGWTDLLSAVAQRAPALGASLYRVTASFLSYADAHGWIAGHPLPRRGGSRIAPSVARRERVLTDDEIRKVWAAAAAMRPGPRCFVQLLMTTGCRIGEAAGIAVGELDAAELVWRLPGSRAKNDRAHVMPVPAPLMAALVARIPDGDRARMARYRLLGRTRGGALSGYSKIKAELDRVSGVRSWRFHDVRRSVRTRLSQLGVAREVAEACLNHVGGRAGIVGTYDRHGYEAEAVAALRLWQDALAALVEPGASPDKAALKIAA